MKKIFCYTGGLLAGFVNGLLGTGGGIIIVTLLKKLGIEAQKAHATSVCVILPLCILSTVVYLHKNFVTFQAVLPYIPSGIIGAIIGSLVLAKIKTKVLRKIFSIFVIWAAWQLLFA